MATRTISTLGGSWKETTAWAEAAVPTASDDVVATALSGNLTLEATGNCRSINLTNYTGTFTHASGITLNVSNPGTPGAGSAINATRTCLRNHGLMA